MILYYMFSIAKMPLSPELNKYLYLYMLKYVLMLKILCMNFILFLTKYRYIFIEKEELLELLSTRLLTPMHEKNIPYLKYNYLTEDKGTRFGTCRKQQKFYLNIKLENCSFLWCVLFIIILVFLQFHSNPGRSQLT
jgi:hypothetical protein